jgi:hypothetical protein
MTAILAQMRGYAVCARLDCDQRGTHGVGTPARACVAQGSDVIDINSKT